MLRLLEWLPWASSGIYVIGALLAAAIPAQGWPTVSASTRVALGAATIYCAAAPFFAAGLLRGAGAAPIVSILIAFLGWVIGAYSRRYLRGEAGQSRFALSFLATLAAVSAVAVSTNLGVLIVAWAASSVGLHHLLTFYRERPAAIIVAHKKFLASRLAEGLLVIAAILLYREWGTLDISVITAHAQAGIALPRTVGAAAVMISAAVLLKCAQLPLHGWLIQVMEAPTPVSALLHAGVVNLGGYVLIRLAPLIGASPVAQTLLVIVGSLTAAIAGLVMLTRITIKVRLAWSTCSQMGFMVMECGLGLYDLALLHLVAHAIYKAHAFLTAGEAVRDGLARQLIARTAGDAARRIPPGPLLALPVAWMFAAGSAVLWHAFGLPMVPWIATALLACGLATLLWTPARGLQPNWRGLLALAAGAQLYVGWHWVMAEWIGVATLPPNVVLEVWSLLVFVALYAAQVAVVMRRPAGSASPFYDWIYAGLYLDERFTRLTFRIWPARGSERPRGLRRPPSHVVGEHSMNSAFNIVIPPRPAFASAIEDAIGAIAPNWPLDRLIAVNPYWGFIDRTFDQAAATLRRLVGSRFTLAPSEYLSAWRTGEISQTALRRALAESSASVTLDNAVASLQIHRPLCTGLPLPSDILDERATPGSAPRWCDTITQQVSQYCASYFDEHQADWHRGRAGGLFRGWRGGLESDHALEPLMHAPQIRARVQDLPGTADGAITWSLERLGVPPAQASEFLQVCLLRINGWASWCAYLGWEAGLRGDIDPNLRELLAIRVAWESLLHDAPCEAESPGSRWREQWTRARSAKPSPFDQLDLIWQRAHEISYQDRLVGLLTADRAGRSAPRDVSRRAAQLVFCIDVRSERFRRALESFEPALETRGFAGFFGLPIRYTPIGTKMSRPQLPGLLAPTIDATESTGDARVDEAIARRRASRLEAKGHWQPFQRLPSGAFSLVETLGIGYVSAILRRHFGAAASPVDSIGMTTRDARTLRPHLLLADGDSIGRKTDLVTSSLRAMSLTSGFARLLVLVGHGSQSANNPQAAALDCGACGGQTGEVNSRVLAGLLNDDCLRVELRKRGVDIPEDTVAVAALHNTTTDEVTLFDVAQLPESHAPDLERLQRSLAEAGHRTRLERAPSLGVTPLLQRTDALLKQIRRRARDWAETRPEWGLADNAAFIVAPRSRTRGLDLAGRSFLHDYTWADDRDGAVLELIITAPMLVTHWINLQYHASTVDPVRFGSGNKVLHNVACGRIGVFEGNTGDLRIGLSRQSVHDGERWMHTPLRLSVFVDAPREMIDGIIARHPTVRRLVEHQWLYLFRFADAGIERRHEGMWLAWDSESATP